METENGPDIIEDLFDRAKREEGIGNKASAEELYTQAIRAFEGKNEIEVETHQEKDCSRYEKIALAYNNRGYLHYLKVEFSEAVSDFTCALHLNPSLSVAYYNRGLIHYRLGRFDEAIKDQQKTLHLDPDFSSAKHCLQESILSRQGQNEKLISDSKPAKKTSGLDR